MHAQPTTSPAALAAYWRGRALLERRDVSGNLAAASTRSSRRPHSIRALGWRTRHSGRPMWSKYVNRETRDARAEGDDAGMTALRLIPRARGAVTRRLTLAGTGQLDEAIRASSGRRWRCSRAYEDARVQLGRLLARRATSMSAVAEFRRRSPMRARLRAAITAAMGLALLEAGRYEDAARAFERVAELQPDNRSRINSWIRVSQRWVITTSHPQLSARVGDSTDRSAYSNIGAIHHGAVSTRRPSRRTSRRSSCGRISRNLSQPWRRIDLKSGKARDALEAYRASGGADGGDLQVNPRECGRSPRSPSICKRRAPVPRPSRRPRRRAVWRPTTSRCCAGLRPYTPLPVDAKRRSTRSTAAIAEGYRRGSVPGGRGFRVAPERARFSITDCQIDRMTMDMTLADFRDPRGRYRRIRRRESSASGASDVQRGRCVVLPRSEAGLGRLRRRAKS